MHPSLRVVSTWMTPLRFTCATRAILRTPHDQPLTGHPLPTKSGNHLLTEPSQDMADHYGDAELIYGDFRNRLPADMRNAVHAATKWCVFGPIGQPVTTDYVLQAVKERSRRLGGRVELLQFHWHDVSGDGLTPYRWPLVNIEADTTCVCAVLFKGVSGRSRRTCEDHADAS